MKSWNEIKARRREIDDARAARVEITVEFLRVHLTSGAVVEAPLERFPRLVAATHDQRARWQLVADGIGIQWEEIEEDVSVPGLLRDVDRDRRGSGSSDPQPG